MKYPNLDSLERTPHIVDGMISDIAYREQECVVRNAYRSSEYVRQIGQQCLAVSDGNAVLTDIVPPVNLSPDEQLYERVHMLMQSKEQPYKLARYQRKLHESTIGALNAWRREAKSPHKWGRVVELTALASLTRYAHPAMLAYPSLSHHEQDTDLGSHYDIGVVFRNPDQTVSSHYVQVKAACFDQCANPHSKAPVIETQDRYRPIIQLLSGCCDLDMNGRAGMGSNTAALLVKERRGAATYDEIKQLDVISDRLILNLTSDLLLRGTNQGNGLLAKSSRRGV